MSTDRPSHQLQPLNIRRTVTVEELAGRIDLRLFEADELSDDYVQARCAFAAQQGLGSVITTPERVRTAATVLHGTNLDVGSVVGWHTPGTDRLDDDTVQAQAESLVEAGATCVAYVVTAARVQHDQGRQVASQLERLVAVGSQLGVKVRAILNTDELTNDQIERSCGDAASAGVWMVQGGSWHGPRAGLSQIERMRAALPANVLLKWAAPVKTLNSLLLCLSLGVDRFNCDAEQILAEAVKAQWTGPLIVPSAGVDY